MRREPYVAVLASDFSNRNENMSDGVFASPSPATLYQRQLSSTNNLLPKSESERTLRRKFV